MRKLVSSISVGLVVSLVLGLAAASPASAAEDANWVRYSAISPDGATVAFAYRGDLWSVPTAGGDATRLTSHEGLETRPIWSHDGTQIAFASDRHGNFDVFVMASEGGAATRLTHHSTNDLPCDFTRDGQRVLFSTTRQDAPESILPSTRIGDLWSIPVGGGRPQMELTTPAEWARVSPDGNLVAYEDKRGYEDEWRKHHTSPVSRDIWVWNRAAGTHDRVTDWNGEDRKPVWAADGSLYFMSERGGTLNIFHLQDGSATQISSHETHPTRFLTIADDGLLCYGWNGGVFVLREGEEPRRVVIRVTADARRNGITRSTEKKGATGMALSPDGEEIAFILRGEVFVTSVDHGTTKRITTTPEQERSVAWSKDGTQLFYASERRTKGAELPSWNLYSATLARTDDERLHLATLIDEKVVLADGNETFQPVTSPDGTQVAFLRNRDEICVLTLASGDVRTMIPAERNYSYSDGDITYAWSPDSRWLAVTYLANKSWIEQIGIVDVAAGTVRNVTMSGYYEGNPKWSPDGRALYFMSNRHGRRSHGSWGSDRDVVAIYLTRAAYDRARLSKEDFARLLEKEEKAKRKQRGGKRVRKKKSDDDESEDGGNDDDDDQDEEDDEEDEDEAPTTVEIEFKDMERRVRRITMHSAPISDFIVSKNGEACVYGAQMDGKWDVWMVEPRKGETKRLLTLGDKGGPQLALSRDGKTLFVRRNDGRIAKARVSGAFSTKKKSGRGNSGGGSVSSEPVSYAAELELDAAAERAHLFEHIWRQAGAKFYNPNLHGVDWDALRANYARFIPELENGFEFAELASELLGELNASHTGCRWRPRRPDGDQTAALGLLFDTTWETDGLKIAEVVAGGPCELLDSQIRAGDVLTSIDGRPLGADVNPMTLLNRKAGKRMRLGLRSAAGESYEQVVRPISGGAEGGLLYRRLQERRRAIVEKASGGRIGYVHVAGMNDRSFRILFREALGRSADKEALIVDTRFNGGGWLHDDLVVFLSGKRYYDFVPRGKQRGEMGSEPIHRWAKPSCVVMSEGNYSDAHMFPAAYKMHGIGKLVGAPVAGTGTAVWWERLMDPALVFGIPQVGMVDREGRYAENNTLEPDVLVLTDPVKIAAGVDEQLLAAVRTLLEELDD